MKKKVVSLTSAILLTSSFATSALANTHTVQKGDTLYQIAKKYNTDVQTLKSVNQLSSDLLSINQVLKVIESKTTVAKPVQTVKTTVTANAKYHKVVSGDTLSKIAKKNNVSVANIKKWNNLKSDVIYPGQNFLVSKTSTSSSNNVAAEESPTPSSSASEGTTYIVISGDSLWKIGKQFGLTVQELKTLNHLKSDTIHVGQKLIVSKTESSQTENSVEEDINPSAEPVIELAKSLIGTPYVWGGNSPAGFDCSGFIHYVFNQSGTKIGRYSTDGYYSRSYYVDKPVVGDLVFFENTYKPGISHMGIYIGNNEFIHADGTKGVMITSLNNSYYKQRFDGFKRFY
jgi:LysM repeat protein